MASFAKTLAAVVIRGCCLESRDRDRNCAPPLEAQVGAIQGVAVARLAGCGLGRRGRAEHGMTMPAVMRRRHPMSAEKSCKKFRRTLPACWSLEWGRTPVPWAQAH